VGGGWQHTVFLRSEAVVLVVFDLSLAAHESAFPGLASTLAFWLNSVYSSRSVGQCKAGSAPLCEAAG
jgi:hypothetical protein